MCALSSNRIWSRLLPLVSGTVLVTNTAKPQTTTAKGRKQADLLEGTAVRHKADGCAQTWKGKGRGAGACGLQRVGERHEGLADDEVCHPVAAGRDRGAEGAPVWGEQLRGQQPRDGTEPDAEGHDEADHLWNQASVVQEESGSHKGLTRPPPTCDIKSSGVTNEKRPPSSGDVARRTEAMASGAVQPWPGQESEVVRATVDRAMPTHETSISERRPDRSINRTDTTVIATLPTFISTEMMTTVAASTPLEVRKMVE